MKTILLSLFSIMLTTRIFAQDAAAENDTYVKTMSDLLGKMTNMQTADQCAEMANSFERVALTETDKWLPFYYSALATLSAVYMEKEPKKMDALIDKAEEMIEKADGLSPENSEIYVLKAMSKGARIMVDPMKRGMEFGAMSAEFVAKAKALNKLNPRAALYEAQSKFYTPEAFGGGKKVALPMAEMAMKLFENFRPESSIMPNWGMDQAKQLIQQCTATGKK